MLYQNILETIGHTPTIKLQNICPNKNVNLYMKLEGQNPSGSIKDRFALYTIEKAEKEGNLTKEKIILEATSGNMGISTAFIGAVKGYKVSIIMSEAMSDERKMLLKSFGAELILTDPSKGTLGAIEKAKELITKNSKKYWFIDQFNNKDNIQSHYEFTSKDILNDVPDIDTIILGIGTGGTIMGIAKRFKEFSPNTKIVAVIPPKGYKIQGIQNPENDFSGNILNSNIIDKRIEISVEEAYEMSRQLAKKEGIFGGMSTGAMVLGALEIAKNNPNGNIFMISPDRGEKYLSTKLFNES